MSEPMQTPPPPPPPSDPPPPEGPSQPQGNAWERRAELGFVEGLVGVVKGFISAPGATFEETRKTGDLGSPVLFAIIVTFVAAIIGQIWAMMFGTSLLAMMPQEAREALPMFIGAQGAGFMVSVFVIPIVTIVGIFIGSAILHLMLLLVGGLDTSDAGFEGSFRVVAYSMVAKLAEIIPFLGGIISLIWTVVLLVIGVNRLHGTSEGKAVAAVLLPIVLCCVCGGIMMMAGLGAVFSGLAG